MSSCVKTRSLFTSTFVLLIPFALATWQLNTDALWYDEIMNYYFVGAAQYQPFLSPGALLERIMLTDRWPPLYYFILIGWSTLAGWGAFTGRVLSLYLGVLTVAAAYRLGADVGGRRAGVWSALLLGTSAFFVYFMHELRAYTLYPLALMLSLLFYWRVLAWVTPWRALGFVGWTLAALYSHPSSYPMIAVLGVYHLLFARRRETWGRVLLLFVITALLTLPWLLVIFYKLGQGQQIGDTTVWLPLLAFLPSYGNGVWLLLAVMLVYAAVFVRGRGAGMVAFVFLGTLLLNLGLNVAAPFLFHMRHLIALLPLMFVVCALAVDHAARRRPVMVVGLVVVWVGAGVWNSFDFGYMLRTPGHEPTLPLAAVDTLVEVEAACIGSEDVVILHIGEPVVRGQAWEWIHDIVMVYYWRDVPFRFGHISTLEPIANDDPIGEDPQTQVTDMREYAPKAAQFIDGAAHVWWFRLKRLPEIEQTVLLDEVLRENGYTAREQPIDTHDLSGWVYTRAGEAPPSCEL